MRVRATARRERYVHVVHFFKVMECALEKGEYVCRKKELAAETSLNVK